MTAPAAATGVRGTPQAGRRGWGGLADAVGVAPPMALFALFIVVPMIIAIALSFVSWNGVGAMRFAGGANWAEFFHDPVARSSIGITVKLVVLSYVIQTPISLALGLFTAGRARYRAVYAAIYVLPMLISTAGVSLMWESFLDSQFGPLHGQNWLGDPATAIYALTLIIAWQFIPFHTLLYAVGRRQIPAVLYEAARIDGAGPVQVFLKVTLPQLRYTMVTSGILMIVGALTYFDIIYIITGGGPGTSTRVLSLHMYLTAFQSDQFGYSSVLAVVLGVIGIAIAMVMVKFSGFAKMQSQQEGVA